MHFHYTEEKLKEISFPLGGIGAGCIGLAGNGRLIDWEIQNRPNKGSYNGYSHFAIKVEKDARVVEARILNGDLHPPYSGNYGGSHFNSFGFGPPRAYLSGVPHFKDVEFRGEFPIARLAFIDDTFPGKVEITAFNPFIPLNDQDSSLPAAFFEICVTNPTGEDLHYTLTSCIGNMSGGHNEYIKRDFGQGIKMNCQSVSQDDVHYGNLTIATDMDDVSYQEYWYRGNWFDDLEIYWRDLNTPGKFINRNYENKSGGNKIGSGNPGDMCTLAAHFSLPAGETKKVRFVLTWYYPNCANYWTVGNEQNCCSCETPQKGQWKNYYATLFRDSLAVAEYSLKNWDRLYEQALRFKEALFSSTLPPAVIDAVSANLSILKSPTVLRLEDGSFYGFEGCHCDSGCCEGSCTHVWNYAYALPFLFPGLERSMRELDYRYNLREDGGMSFRLQLPLGSPPSSFRPCADGQLGGVLKTYREWKISGNDEWLRSLWPSVKKSIEYAWADTNKDRWDPEQKGVLTGRQHHTLDMELFGPNSWLTGFYLAALKAGSEMANHLGDEQTAQKYIDIFHRGKAWVDSNLFNGEYYYHCIDLEDKSILEYFDSDEAGTLIGGSTLEAYWDEERGEIKYQVGEGCIIDQVLAQWHANLIGLGEIFDPDNTREAIYAVYKNNFKKRMREVFNPCRVFSLNDESGMIICSYPENSNNGGFAPLITPQKTKTKNKRQRLKKQKAERIDHYCFSKIYYIEFRFHPHLAPQRGMSVYPEGKRKPAIPVPYAQETMNGFEYQAAAHLIQEGFIKEGQEVVEAIRERYDGEKRNPWNEFECGSNYARSMASYALLLAYSAFVFDMTRHLIGFNPVIDDIPFRIFWSLDSGWGIFERAQDRVELKVLYGYLDLAVLRLPFIKGGSIESIHAENRVVDYHNLEGDIVLDGPIRVEEGSSVIIKLR